MVRRIGSFLSRLTNTPTTSQAEVIVRNLDHLFNTRKRVGSVVAEFGLGDYEAAPTTHDAVLLLREELEGAVRRYEPRIESPQVRLLGGFGYSGVRYELRGRAHGEALVFSIDIDTTTRQVRVAAGATQ